jgi:hypothetical protein
VYPVFIVGSQSIVLHFCDFLELPFPPKSQFHYSEIHTYSSTNDDILEQKSVGIIGKGAQSPSGLA